MPVLVPPHSAHGHLSWSPSPPSSPPAPAPIALIPDFAAYLQPRVRRLTAVSEARAASLSLSLSASPSPAASPVLAASEPEPVDEPSVRTTFTFAAALSEGEYAALDRLTLDVFHERALSPYHSGFLVRPAGDAGDEFATRFWVQTAARYSGEFEPAVLGFIRAVLGDKGLRIDVRVEDDDVW
ncbi:hypothetical protein Q8F55_006845 [Vanrija albida]|uniref:Uncharacterized protein n=1 Tax=Vanrija albida TaxID=181172 RepID=A0ABR3PYC6_9TREE